MILTSMDRFTLMLCLLWRSSDFFPFCTILYSMKARRAQCEVFPMMVEPEVTGSLRSSEAAIELRCTHATELIMSQSSSGQGLLAYNLRR